MYRKLPFYIVLISSLLPLVAAYNDSKILTQIPALFALIIFLFFHLLTSFNNFKFSRNIYFVGGVVIFYCTISIIRSGEIASFGSIGVIVLSIVFFSMLDSGNSSLKTLVRQVSIIYTLHILYIYFEITARISGYDYLFIDFFGVPSSSSPQVAITYFKDYNSAALLRYFGFSINGANSLLLGSQSASMLVLFSVIWFSKIFKGNFFDKSIRFSRSLLICSLFLYPFVATMTLNFVFIMLFSLFFLFRNKRVKISIISFFLLIILLPFGKSILGLITFRVQSLSDLEQYTGLFTYLLFDFMDLGWVDKIFGLGKYDLSELGITQYTSDGFPLGSGDFGFGHILNSAGLILSLLVVFSLITIFLKVWALVNKSKINVLLDDPWVGFMSINLIIMFGYFLSLSHYTTAIEFGGRELFAFHIALTLLSIKRVRSLISSYDNISNNKPLILMKNS